MPHSTYSKKKKFSSLRRDKEETAQNFRQRFFIAIALPKFYAAHRIYEILLKSLVPSAHK
jgi:hypothetical protein